MTLQELSPLCRYQTQQQDCKSCYFLPVFLTTPDFNPRRLVFVPFSFRKLLWTSVHSLQCEFPAVNRLICSPFTCAFLIPKLLDAQAIDIARDGWSMALTSRSPPQMRLVQSVELMPGARCRLTYTRGRTVSEQCPVTSHNK